MAIYSLRHADSWPSGNAPENATLAGATVTCPRLASPLDNTSAPAAPLHAAHRWPESSCCRLRVHASRRWPVVWLLRAVNAMDARPRFPVSAGDSRRDPAVPSMARALKYFAPALRFCSLRRALLPPQLPAATLTLPLRERPPRPSHCPPYTALHTYPPACACRHARPSVLARPRTRIYAQSCPRCAPAC